MSYSMVVPPLSRKEIRANAHYARHLLHQWTGGAWDDAWFPIVEFIDPLMQRFDPAYTFEVLEMHELGDAHGNTIPDRNIIQIREDVYDGARKQHGRDRFTMAHELGHLFLHRGISFARMMPKSQLKPFIDSEWQANCFAGELLVDHRKLRPGESPFEAAGRFGVSPDCARLQLNRFRKEGLHK